MAKVACVYCSATSGARKVFCTKCGGRLPDGSAFAPRAPTGGNPASLDYRTGQRRQESAAAARALGVAALMSVLRATIVPFLLAGLPPEKFAAFTSPDVRFGHYASALTFVLAYVWARKDPLPAAITATALYLVIAVPPVLANPTLIGGGHLGKLVTLGILGRALTAGILHRAARFEPLFR